jgi:hypothetical protein
MINLQILLGDINNLPRGVPGEYLEYDNYFENENINDLEKYHHYIGAWAAQDYIDEYSGIYYTPMRCCWTSGTYYRNIKYDIAKDIIIDDIRLTNLIGLIDNACYSREYNDHNNFAVWQDREENDVMYSVIVRLSNPTDEIVNTTVHLYGGYNGPSYANVNLNIQPHRSIKYTIKWNNKFITFDGIEKPSSSSTIAYSTYIHFRNKNPIGTDGNDLYIYINSAFFRVELFKYKLSLTGNTHNYCYRSGCLENYYCSKYSGATDNRCNHTVPEQNYNLRGYCNTEGCIPGAYCDSTENLYMCKECDIRCRTCINGQPNKCRSCYPTAVSPYWHTHVYFPTNTPQPCKHEYIAFNHFLDFEIEIPLLLNYRGTMEFWMFVINPEKLTDSILQPSYSAFVFQNFFTVIIHQNPDSNHKSDIQVTLIPFDNIYPYNKKIMNLLDFENYYTSKYTSYQSVTKNIENKASRWVFVRAGFSYTHKKMQVNGEEKNIEYPYIYLENIPTYKTTYQTFLKTFYRENEHGILRVQGFQYINTDIYIRNLNYYADYLNNEINNPNYYNLHEINDIYSIPNLLFSIPFNDIVIADDSNDSTFSYYDYSSQFTKNTRVISNIIIQLIPSSLAPSKNFHRIKFLTPNNYYKNSDLKVVQSLSCSNPNKYCSDDEIPYSCINSNLFHKTDNSIVCTTNCLDYPYYPSMRLPNIKINHNNNNPITNDICNYKCDSRVNNCPSGYNSNINSFSCNTNYNTLFYQCLDKNEYKVDNSGLQFSGTYRTKSMIFPLSPSSNPISNFMIEMWFHPDMHTQANPPLYKQFIFMSDSLQIYFDINLQEYVFKSVTNGFTSINELGFNIYYYGWNHLIISSKPITVNNQIYTEFNVSIANSFLKVDQVLGKNTIYQICFCNIDDNCCGTESNALWFDMFIKDIKLWDARFVGPYTLFDFNKFSYIIPGGLLHWYKLDITNLNNNDIKCEIDNSYKVSYISDKYFLNPHNDQNFNYGFNFNWNDVNYPNFVINAQIISERNIVNITQTGQCYEGCSQCFGNSKYNCFKCNEYYALNGATCTLNSQYNSNKFYINPPEQSNIPGEINELEIVFPNTYDPEKAGGMTIFFYMKLYGFTSELINNYISSISSDPILNIVYFSNILKLSYDVEEESLKLLLNNIVQFQFDGFSKKIATWVPISIAAFRGLTIQKDFNSMTLGSTPLKHIPSTYSKFYFRTIRFSKYMIGYISDITIYDTFIINALGYASHKDNINSIFRKNYGLDIILFSFPLKSTIISDKENEDETINTWSSSGHCLNGME